MNELKFFLPFFIYYKSVYYNKNMLFGFFLQIYHHIKKTNDANQRWKKHYEVISPNHLFITFSSFPIAIFNLFQSVKRKHLKRNEPQLPQGGCRFNGFDLKLAHQRERQQFGDTWFSQEHHWRRMQRLIRSWVGPIRCYNQLLLF